MQWMAAVYREVVDWREHLGVQGLATLRDTYRLAEALDGLSIEWMVGVKGHLLMDRSAGGGVIFLDPTLPDGEKDAALLEEIGHYLFRDYVATPAGIGRRAFQLADGKSENPAQAFVTMWRLHGANGTTDEELAVTANCRPDEAGRYRELLMKIA